MIGLVMMLCAMGTGDSLPVEALKNWTIVVAPEASPSEAYAAQELRTLLKQALGTELALSNDTSIKKDAILVGSGASGIPAEKFEDEELSIRVSPKRIVITGGRPRGTLYGVYEFCERYLGAAFLTADHTYFPPVPEMKPLPKEKYSFNPTFAFRWSYYNATMADPAFAARLRTNTVSDDPKLGGRTGYRLVSHNVAYLVPPEKYGKEHPEYFALVDGVRKLVMGGGGPNLCMTNPAVVDLVTQAVLEEIAKNPTAKNINIAQMDQDNYCTCPNCAALDEREGSHAAAHLALVNTVAERIEKAHPDVLISCYAYQYTRKPCKTLRARHNVLIQLCSIECCDLHAIDDPACSLNRAFCEDMEGWKSKTDHMLIWHYNTNFRGYELPFPNLRSIGGSVNFFAKNNGDGVFMQAAGNGASSELSDLRNYVMSRCLWNPGRDSWQEAETFCKLHYKEAAGPILAYLAYYHDLVQAAGVHPTCFPTESALCINPETARRIMGYFQEALSLAQSDEVRARVEKASICAYRAALSASAMKLTYADGICKPNLAGLEPGLLDRYTELCARYGVTMEGEETPLQEYLDGIGKLFTTGLKAVSLENDAWRVVLLPETNGKVVEMTYKPTGRNVVQATRALSRFRYEDWVAQGEGPSPKSILPFEAQAQADKVVMTLTTADGTHVERTVSLAGDAVRFEFAMTANAARPFDVMAHPEYDTASMSDNPGVLAAYVKTPEWVQINRDWKDATPTPDQVAAVRTAVGGGAFAYYNHEAKFGVEQRFSPEEFGGLGLFWSPSRVQVNLELQSKIVALEKGQQARLAYEVRYLAEPPVKAE
ncbi:MAG: DUF4838 domain-containing protein [FCB group bacterium]|nr:DUF4838 domain-containing protein [FCB group bacterium]